MVSVFRALLSSLSITRLSPTHLSHKTAAMAAAGSLAAATSLLAPTVAQAQSTDIPTTDVPAEASGATRAVEGSNSPIGIAAGQALMAEAEGAIAAQDYGLAATKLVEARKALNDVSTYYQNLSGVFVGVDSRVNSDLRSLALESAQVRDQASYQLAVVYRAQDRPDLAVPLLVEVVSSQQPTRPLGQQAYQQLYELGFVGVAYDAPG